MNTSLLLWAFLRSDLFYLNKLSQALDMLSQAIDELGQTLGMLNQAIGKLGQAILCHSYP